MAAKSYDIVDEGDLRKYRIEIPNMLDESDLDPYEFRLYAHLKRRAGDSGACNEGARKIAVICKMSVGKVVESKKSLVDKGLIKVIPGDPTTSTPDTILIANVWPDNLQYIRKNYPRSQSEQPPVHTVNTPVHGDAAPRSQDEHPRSPGERKKEPTQEITKKEKTITGSRASAHSPREKKISEMSEEDFMTYLRAEPAYSHVDIERESGKFRKFWLARNKEPTRRRFISWLNNIDPPISDKTEGNGHGKNQRPDGKSEVGPRTATLQTRDYSVFNQSPKSTRG